jgi:hypothetical protein
MPEPVEGLPRVADDWAPPKATTPMRPATRRLLDTVVHADPSIEFVVAFYRDGDTDTFSSEPTADTCHRHRVIERCRELVKSIQKMTSRPRAQAACPGSSRKAKGCPA